MIIVFTGVQHAVELYYKKLLFESSVLYAFEPINPDTSIIDAYPEIEREFLRVKNDSNQDQIFEMLKYMRKMHPEYNSTMVGKMLKESIEIAAKLFGHTGSKLYQFNTLEQEKPKVIVFGDIHGVEGSPQISEFPVESIKALGFKKVTLLVEPYGVEDQFGPDELEAHAKLGTQFLTDAVDFRQEITKISVVLEERLSRSQTIILPSTKKIAQLSRGLKRAGLEVKIRGLEPESFFINVTGSTCKQILK